MLTSMAKSLSTVKSTSGCDPDGGNTLASTSFTIEAVNDGPEFKGSEPITLANIQEDSELVFTEDQLLNGFSDRDGDLSLSPV